MSDSVPRIEIGPFPCRRPLRPPLNTARNHYTLIEVRTDAASPALAAPRAPTLVRAALGLLEPQYCGEVAIEPSVHKAERQPDGAWRTVTPLSTARHHLWDIFGQVAPAHPRLLGGYY